MNDDDKKELKMVNGVTSEQLSPVLLRLAGYVMVLYCPGCEICHHIHVDKPGDNGASWGWDKNVEKPTFTPSILVRYNFSLDEANNVVCHSFIRNGRWEFLGDCTHALKNQTVDMVEIPEDHR